jgi:hypothetical protein
MKSKNIINKVISTVDIIPKTPGNKKQDVNVNTYMKKSKRNNNKENIIDIIPEPVIPEHVIPEPVKQDILPKFNITSDLVTNIKALNLIKAREALQINIQNKNINREEKILNLINEIKEEELLKIENKTEKLKNKLMKLI